MIKATPPPKVKDTRLLAIPLLYAVGLAVLALLQLIGFGGFDFAGINFETQGSSAAIIAMSASEIFALPFLLRLHLSPLARACSAVLSLAAPLLMLGNAIFMRDQISAPITPLELTLGAVLGILAISSFNILQGEEALKVPKK